MKKYNPKKREIYLDHAASTPLDPSVQRVMQPLLSNYYGNPSALHKKGRESHAVLENARGVVANVLQTQKKTIVFTASGTESDNLAIRGIARSYGTQGKHIITTKIEHKAVLETLKELEREGFDVTYLSVNSEGLIDIEELKRSLRKDTILVSIIYANNEIGTIQPLSHIKKTIKKHRDTHSCSTPFFHTDACQAGGSENLNVSSLGVDMLTLNGSKVYGPKGVGCLYVKESVRLSPILCGGEQEHGLRAGTENLLAIVGFSEALRISDSLKYKESKRLTVLRDYFFYEVKKRCERVVINGHKTKRLPNNINVSFPGIEGESLVLLLDKLGVYASTGSACAAHDLSASHVILSLDPDPLRAHGSVRFSMGRKTTKKDIDYVLKILPDIEKTLRNLTIQSL